jgi:DNA-binding transcriptional ArsR family regulator
MTETVKENGAYKKWVQFNLSGKSFKDFSNITNDPNMKVMLFIVEHMDHYNALVCSYKVIEEALGISQATVARSIKFLREKGMIYVRKSGTSNVYTLNPEIAWKSWGSNKKYCKFPANILLSHNEQ